MAEKYSISQWQSQSPALNPIHDTFQLLKTKMKAEGLTHQKQLKVVAVKAWHLQALLKNHLLALFPATRHLHCNDLTFKLVDYTLYSGKF